MPAALNGHLFDVARRVGLAQRVAFGTDRVGLLIAGFEVNHCHLHCVPANAIADLDFSRQEQGVSADAASRLAAQLRADGVPGAL